MFNHRLKVVRRRHVGSELHWIVVLPDGSHSSIPSSWTDQADNCSRARFELPEGRASPNTLRNLLRLLDNVLKAPVLIESRSSDPKGGNQNERATSSVRARSEELGSTNRVKTQPLLRLPGKRTRALFPIQNCVVDGRILSEGCIRRIR